MATMLTTVDNPYDPRLDFPAWFSWDVAHGYNTSALLARVLVESDDVPGPIQDRQIEEAMDQIMEMHDGAIYKKLPVPVAA